MRSIRKQDSETLFIAGLTRGGILRPFYGINFQALTEGSKKISYRCQIKSIEFHMNPTDVCKQIKKNDFETALQECLQSRFPFVEKLKPKQLIVTEHMLQRRDVFAQLPTWFGESLTFQVILPILKHLKDIGQVNVPVCRGKQENTLQ